jgi:hypothetical protein
MSSEILYLLDLAQGLCMLEGNISRRDIHELHWNVEMHVGCEHFWASLRRSSGAFVHVGSSLRNTVSQIAAGRASCQLPTTSVPTLNN